MKIQLIKIPRKANFMVMLVLFQFLFSNVLLAKETSIDSPLSTTKKKQLSQQITVSGKITSAEDKMAIPGVTVAVKGNPSLAVISDFDGNYKINVPSSDATLIFSSIGFKTIERKVGSQSIMNILMSSDQTNLEEVIVVGYGKQTKQSVVGAISQVSGDVLRRTGGVTDLSSALTGNVPGLVTLSSSGQPGEETASLLIRARTTWNNSAPLVLVDGVERPIKDVDINSVETISVLKDASATAVFGVRGANGVILITTKRGKEGKAQISVGVNTTAKSIAGLADKYDVYDALMLKNRVVEYELSNTPEVWSYIKPQAFIDNYRNQTTQEQKERYPNIDWVDYLFKDMAMSYGANVNVSGGSEAVKYFTAVDFISEGDLFKEFNSGKGYQPKFSYERFNTRANFDFQLTKSTVFKVNLFGSYGVRTSPDGVATGDYGLSQLVAGAYNTPGDVFYPQYSDGSWGFYYPETSGVVTQNSALIFANSGPQKKIETRFSTDFILHQDLDFVLKGLNFEGTVSWDNRFTETGRGVDDTGGVVLKWIDPETGIAYGDPNQTIDNATQFDWVPSIIWTTSGGTIDNTATYRNLNYNGQLNYGNTFFDKHNLTLMGRFMRSEQSKGASIPSYREDWIFRTTYNFDRRYYFEYNGAYNGSEQFSPKYRFGFFSSGAAGWMLTEEKFMKNVKFLNMLKLKASYGKIGDDSNQSSRFVYQDIWRYANNSPLGLNPGAGTSSPYTWYTQTQVGNPDIRWEIVTKKNLGLEFEVFNRILSGSVDVFSDFREDILLTGSSRAVPSYFGATPPMANIGKVKGKGYEVELHFNKLLSNSWRVWTDVAFTKATNVVVEADDPLLEPDYQKVAGYPIEQYRSNLTNGYYNTFDELYGSTPLNSDQKIPGAYNIVDYDGDGTILNDAVPYAYAERPQMTYNISPGFEWKGLRVFAQFYGVTNATRWVSQDSFDRPFLNNVYEAGSYWSPDDTNADTPLPRLLAKPGRELGNRFIYDASYLSLRNAEISYTFNSNFVKKMGFKSMRVYINGNNLAKWSKMPDNRESGGGNAYPTIKRYNLGLNVNL
jgi:TonB-linked SusC/RagA family outer membrane protein